MLRDAGAGAGRAAGALLGGRTLERAADVDDIEALTRALDLPADAVRRAVGGLALGNPRLLARTAELATRAAEALFTADCHLNAELTRTALLTSLLAIGEDFARERAPHEVHAMILDAASILFDARRACLLFTTSARAASVCARHSAHRPGCSPPPGSPPTARCSQHALRERAPAVVTDRARIRAGGSRPGPVSLALFPLFAGDRALAVLCVLDTPLSRARPRGHGALPEGALALSNALLREDLALSTREFERSNGYANGSRPCWRGRRSSSGLRGSDSARRRARSLVDALRPRRRSLRSRGRADRTPRSCTRSPSPPATGSPAASPPTGGRCSSRSSRATRGCAGRAPALPHRLVPRRAAAGARPGDRRDQPRRQGGRRARSATDDLSAVLMVTAHASWALQRSALHGRMCALREQAVTDSLTGLSNRRYLEARLREEAGRTRRHGSPFALMMIDLDDFKRYNDREGHPAGDALLAAVARVIRDGRPRHRPGLALRGRRVRRGLPRDARRRGPAAGRADPRSPSTTHALRPPRPARGGGLTLSVGVAGFPVDADDPDALMPRGRRRALPGKGRGEKPCRLGGRARARLMRHLFVTQDYPPDLGGMARRHVELCRRLAPGDVSVSTVLSGAGSSTFDRAEGYPIERQPFTAAEAKLLVNQLRWSRRIHRWCRDGGGLVHLGNIRPCGYAVGLGTLPTGTPYLIYVNGGDLLREGRFARQAARRWSGRHLYSRALGIVANSRWTADLARATLTQFGARPVPVAAIDLGTDPEFFSPRRDTGALRRRLGLGAAPLLLTVARLVPHKGQDIALRALATLVREFPDLSYLLVGEGHDRQRLEALARDLGVAQRVVFAGVLTDGEIAEAYATATLYVGLSRVDDGINAEGFGISFIEAAAGGVPVVAGDSGGVRSAVRDGETGLVVPPADPAAVAAAVRGLLASPDRRRDLGAAGRRAVETHYNWDRVALETLDFVRQIAG